MTLPSVPHALRGAAARIRRGWCQRKFKDVTTGEVCILGAICDVVPEWASDLVVEVASALHAEVCPTMSQTPFIDLMQWNDDYRQSAENIATACERTATAIEQTEVLV